MTHSYLIGFKHFSEFLFQGCWLECQSDAECLAGARENVALLYANGVYGTFVELLSLEMEDASAASVAMRKLAVSLSDSTELRWGSQCWEIQTFLGVNRV